MVITRTRPLRLMTVPTPDPKAPRTPVFRGRRNSPERAVTRFVGERLREQPDDAARARRGR